MRRAAGTASRAKRRVQLTLLALCLLLGVLLGTGVFATSGLYRSAEDRYIGLVFPLATLTRDVSLSLAQEEDAVRAYVLTSQRRSLAPYFSGRRRVLADLRRIAALTRGRQGLDARTLEVEREVTALHGFYDRLVVFVADGLLGQRLARAQVLEGEPLTARTRRTMSLMQRDIDRFVASTRHQQQVTYDRALAALAVVGFLALAIAATLLVRVPERLRALYAVEEDARVQAEEGANSARALAHVSDAVVLVDDGGWIRSWNAAAERLFGVDALHALGRPATVVVPGYDALVAGAERADAFVPVVIADGELWLAPSVSDFEGGSVLTIRDVTAGYLLERARSDFVATASHELRTPLTTIYGGIRTLLGRGEELEPDQRQRLLRLIEQESAQLAKIVEQLSVSTSLDRGTLSVDETDVDMRSLCEEVVEGARARQPAGIELALHAPEEPVLARGDEALLRQVLVNLVENAIKYSPGGGRVDVRLRERGGTVLVDVQDRGAGIPFSEQERIFEKFYRLDAAMQSGVGGSGLGLYIARAIVTELGGTLTVRSRAGAGSTFTVTLPSSAATRLNVA